MAKADAVVAMTTTACERLATGYAVDMTKVCIIAHGAPVLQTTMAEPTQFPHAREVLAGGAGLLVPHRDPAAIAVALRSVMTRADVMTRMAAAAAATAPKLLWPVIADQYRELADRLITASVAA